jgi:hypothetical protein
MDQIQGARHMLRCQGPMEGIYGVLIHVTDVTGDTTPFGMRSGHKILAQDIKIVGYARVGWNTRTCSR